jgi:hypothetical protein
MSFARGRGLKSRSRRAQIAADAAGNSVGNWQGNYGPSRTKICDRDGAELSGIGRHALEQPDTTVARRPAQMAPTSISRHRPAHPRSDI